MRFAVQGLDVCMSIFESIPSRALSVLVPGSGYLAKKRVQCVGRVGTRPTMMLDGIDDLHIRVGLRGTEHVLEEPRPVPLTAKVCTEAR